MSSLVTEPSRDGTAQPAPDHSWTAARDRLAAQINATTECGQVLITAQVSAATNGTFRRTDLHAVGEKVDEASRRQG